ncbi:MAG: DUF1501 domain-containing protein [Planctomycetales bacterium]|nr:DUF1501 domain-containing protein [Planctomycetales bacterium]
MSNHLHIYRRHAMQVAMGGLIGVSSSGWLPRIAAAATETSRKRKCILLWMGGGPSQTDTFDMKPNHANGGEFKEAQTSVPGLRFSEHLPKLAKLADQLAIVRSVSTREGDHSRGTYLMRTGQRPGSPVRFPTIGSAMSKELAVPNAILPNYFSINPTIGINPDAYSPGFLGPRFAAATVGEQQGPEQPQADGFADLKVDNLTLPPGVTLQQANERQKLWNVLQTRFKKSRSASAIESQDTVYRRAIDLMTSDDVEAFDLSKEPDDVREAYGRNRFGQGCLIARRLIERNVPFVEVSLGSGGIGWDTHQDNFNLVKQLSVQLDNGWATLMTDLQERDLLQDTTILWMGEFGRTPQINNMRGRDHFPNAWTCVFAGGGIAGGQAYGATTDDGSEVAENKVSEQDILATFCQAVGVDPTTENVSSIGRPHKISEGTPIAAVLS